MRSVAGNVLRGSIGNLVEWYDWYAYAAFTTYFAKSFFPTTERRPLPRHRGGVRRRVPHAAARRAGCSGGSPTGSAAAARWCCR